MATPVETHEQWAILDDGSVASWRYEGSTPPPLPGPGRLVSREEYEQARAAIVQAVEEGREQAEAAERQQIESDYEALRALGLPDSTARRLTSYTGTDEEAV